MKKNIVFYFLSIAFGFAILSCSSQQKSSSILPEPEEATISEENEEDVDVPEEEFVEEEQFAIEAVDLGLSVLWANANIGATDCYERGDYYAWGESVTKDSYTLDNYFDYDIEVKDGGFVHRGFKVFDKAGQSLDGTDYDTARNIMGGNWRMPTSDEYNELITKCKLASTWLKDKNGNPLKDSNGNVVCRYVEVTGPNGKKIVFPFVGEKEGDSYIQNEGAYWTANMFIRERDKKNAMAVRLGNFMRGPMALAPKNKGVGLNIRAVMDRDPLNVNVKDGEFAFEGRIGPVPIIEFEIKIQNSRVSGRYLYSTASFNNYIDFEGSIDEKNNIELYKSFRDESFGRMEGVFDGTAFRGTDYNEGSEEGQPFKLVVK